MALATAFESGGKPPQSKADFVRKMHMTFFAHLAVDDPLNLPSAERLGNWIDVQMEVRYLDPELQQNGAVGSGYFQQGAFSHGVNPAEVGAFLVRKIGDVLHVTLPHHHRVSGDGGVGMKNDGASIVFVDQSPGAT